MQPDTVDMHWLWKETTNRLARFADAVRECKQVAEAADFCKWLRFSGLTKLFKQFPQDAPFPVDGKIIDKQINDLLFECGELFRKGKADPRYAETDIAQINRKLDALTACLGTITPPFATAELGAGLSPELCVMQGGVS